MRAAEWSESRTWGSAAALHRHPSVARARRGERGGRTGGSPLAGVRLRWRLRRRGRGRGSRRRCVFCFHRVVVGGSSASRGGGKQEGDG